MATLEDILRLNRFWWSSPNQFNDPFDCIPRVMFGQSVREKKRYARDMVRRQIGRASRNVRRKQWSKVARISNEEARDLVLARLSENGIACFSELSDSLLMWSHYADHHRGICFEFNQIDTDPPFIALPVRYSELRPVADVTRMVDAENSFVHAAIFTKAMCWAYEREFRMLDVTRGAGYRDFPREALTGVILGARISEEVRVEIVKAVKTWRPDITVSHASLDNEHYKIVVVT